MNTTLTGIREPMRGPKLRHANVVLRRCACLAADHPASRFRPIDARAQATDFFQLHHSMPRRIADTDRLSLGKYLPLNSY